MIIDNNIPDKDSSSAKLFSLTRTNVCLQKLVDGQV